MSHSRSFSTIAITQVPVFLLLKCPLIPLYVGQKEGVLYLFSSLCPANILRSMFSFLPSPPLLWARFCLLIQFSWVVTLCSCKNQKLLMSSSLYCRAPLFSILTTQKTVSVPDFTDSFGWQMKIIGQDEKKKFLKVTFPHIQRKIM